MASNRIRDVLRRGFVEALRAMRSQLSAGVMWNEDGTSVGELLKQDGDVEIASRIQQFVKEMQPAYVDLAWIAAGLMRRFTGSTPDRTRTP